MEDICPICEAPFTIVGSRESLGSTTTQKNINYVPSTKVAAVIANIRREQQPNPLDPGQGPVKRLATFRGYLLESLG
jgi:hypothetical protein